MAGALRCSSLTDDVSTGVSSIDVAKQARAEKLAQLHRMHVYKKVDVPQAWIETPITLQGWTPTGAVMAG